MYQIVKISNFVFILQSNPAKPAIYRGNLRKLLWYKQNNKLYGYPTLDNFSMSFLRKYHLSS